MDCRIKNNWLLPCILLGVAFGLVASNAYALHPTSRNNQPIMNTFKLASSQPTPNALLKSTPQAIVLIFSQPVNAAHTTINISRAGFGTVLSPTAQSLNENTLTVPLSELEPGVYHVKWHALCDCREHVDDRGTLIVTIKNN
jgi:methionine-rich copper-binding protein CopC